MRLVLAGAFVLAATPARAATPHVLYLDRCVADCPVAAGVDDATLDTSSMVPGGTLTRLPRLDLVWADIVLCMGEILAPYDVTIVESDEPPADTSYVEVMIAGRSEELGLPAGLRGVAPTDDGCAPLDHGLAFVFGNLYDLAAEPERARDLCITAATQVGHLWGLEQTDECRDLMREYTTCLDRPWFVDLDMGCPDCGCPVDTLNTHARLLELLGPGAGPPPPHVEIVGADGLNVIAQVTRGRPLDRVELIADGEVVDTVLADDTGRYTLRARTAGEVTVFAYDDLDRPGGAKTSVSFAEGSCAAGGGGPWWLLGLLILRSARSRARARPRGTASA